MVKNLPANAGDARDTRFLKSSHPEGWFRGGGGRGVQDWEHMYTRGRFMLMYGINQYNIVK